MCIRDRGIHGGSDVSIVINSKFIWLGSPFSSLVWINNEGSQPQLPGNSACIHAGTSDTACCSCHAPDHSGKRTVPVSSFGSFSAQWYPPDFVYGFGAIFNQNTALERCKNPRRIADRADYPPVRLSCFGIIFCVSSPLYPDVVPAPVSLRRFASVGTLVSVRVPPCSCR